MKEVLSGNEAIARGAWEAGAAFASAYPGTPSTEILEVVAAKYGQNIRAQWSTNEKTALECGYGASIAGARALVCMKHVGVNVAADPLFTAVYTGVKGGLVLVSADDPNLHSSQNEQDNRNYAKFAKLPMLEPADSGEALEFTKAAFDISEAFDTPVMLRTTTRISHSKSIAETGGREELPAVGEIGRDTRKYVMLPGHAKMRHPLVEERLKKLADLAENTPLNRIEWGDKKIGIISSGISYQYAKESMPEASFLKLGMTYPLPRKLIKEFASKVKKLIVVEELDPFLEEQIRLMGVEVHEGKSLFPLLGELEPSRVKELLSGKKSEKKPAAEGLPVRPPVLCPGCSHRGVFTVLKKLKVFVSGDIGCYTLAALPPLESMHTCLCMGASITMAHGMSSVLPETEELSGKIVAVIGDSTFFHSGVTGLIDMIWNRGNAVVLIQDNRITAMTGGQENPGSGHTIYGVESPRIDMEKLVIALGVNPLNVRVVNSYDLAQVEKVFREELAKPGPSVVITKEPCVLQFRVKGQPMSVNSEKCTACKRCIGVGCIAISMAEKGEQKFAAIDPNFCTGCNVCAQVCKVGAIVR